MNNSETEKESKTASSSESKIDGNEVDLLRNGREIFPAMLEAIRGARKSICFETYVYWSGAIAEEFAQALEAKAREGVAVHVILDWYGSLKMQKQLCEKLRSAGVQVEFFHPLRWFNIRRTNYRTHRKLLIVDGEIGFTGGVGVAAEWTGDAQDPDHWRDNHYRLEGPIVREIQAVFFRNWSECGHDPPPGRNPRYFPELGTAGRESVSLHHSSPFNGDYEVLNLIRSAIQSARSRLCIATAYFMPGEDVLADLMDAGKRGVSVKILMCGKHIDQRLVRRASRARWGELLQSGVRLFEYQPTLLHVKMLIVDDDWVDIGSANIDARSCRLNAEVVIRLYGERHTELHADVFEEDLKQAKEITYDDWERRPLWTKVLDWLSTLFRSQL